MVWECFPGTLWANNTNHHLISIITGEAHHLSTVADIVHPFMAPNYLRLMTTSTTS